MIFHSFKNQNERRTFGGSAFIEIQYCTQKSGTELKKIFILMILTLSLLIIKRYFTGELIKIYIAEKLIFLE